MAVAARHYSADGNIVITSLSWGNVNAGTSVTSRKFFIQNVGDRDLTGLVFDFVQVGSGDGFVYMKWAADTATLSCPWGFSATVVASGGTIPAATTYYYRITGINATGETTGSIEKSATTAVLNSSILLQWTALPGSTGYKIYRTVTSGAYGASSLLVSTSGVSYTDTGIATSSGTLPSANTTGGAGPAYGTPPTLGTSSITIGTLQVGRQWIYWVGITVGAAVTESGNPRYANRRFQES